MKSTSMDCPYCGRAISQMPPACPACMRAFILDDYSESYPTRWPFRLLFLILSPLLAVGGFLLVFVEALLGFGFVVGGLIVFPSHAVWGWTSIACGAGIFLLMIGKGMKAVLGNFFLLSVGDGVGGG